MNVRVVSRVAEQQKFGNFKKIPELLGYDCKYQPISQKANLDICTKKSQKISCKTLHRKTFL